MGFSHSDYLEFTKMHGAGNDYIYVDATISTLDNPSQIAKEISDPHFGIGADGLVLICYSEIADFKMRIFNADGSEAQMCGNASRCIGKYVYEHSMTSKREITLETLAGIKVLNLHIDEHGCVNEVTVDMGSPVIEASCIPCVASNTNNSGISSVVMEHDGNQYEAIAVSMGNPHAVIFTDNISDELVLVAGPVFESHAAWPERTNVEFARILNSREIEMRVWERGSGETWACGTGACAVAVAAMLTRGVENDVIIHLRGGDLRIRWDRESDRVYMTGPAATIAEGRYFFEDKRKNI